MHGAQYNWPTEKGNGDALGEGAARLTYPPLVIRAGTHLDAHLTSQPFSNCTAPLVRHACAIHSPGNAGSLRHFALCIINGGRFSVKCTCKWSISLSWCISSQHAGACGVLPMVP